MRLLVLNLLAISLRNVESFTDNGLLRRDQTHSNIEIETILSRRTQDNEEDLFWKTCGTSQDGLAINDMGGSYVSLCEDGSYFVVGSHTSVILYRYDNDIFDWVVAYDFTDDLLPNRQFYSYRAVISDDCNHVIIGAPGNDQKGFDAGAAQVFTNVESLMKDGHEEMENWGQVGASLFAERLNEQFGFAVDISEDGTNIIIGAPGADYVEHHERLDHINSWSLVNTLVANAEGDNFGYAVSISGDGQRAIIGAPLGGTLGQNGYVRILSLTNLSFVKMISGNNPGAQIGNAVDISRDGTTVAFSSIVNGHVIVFKFDETASDWLKEGVSICIEDEGFGSSVQLSEDGSCVAIGAPLNNFYGTQAGKAYIYENKEEWTLVGEEQHGTSAFEECGTAVTISSNKDRWGMGCPGSNDGGSGFGKSTIYCSEDPSLFTNEPTMMPTKMPTKMPTVTPGNPTRPPTAAPTIDQFGGNAPTQSPTASPTPENPGNILQLILGLLSLLVSFGFGLILGGINIFGTGCGYCAYYCCGDWTYWIGSCGYYFCGDLTYWWGNTICGYYCCGDWSYWFYSDTAAGAEAGVEAGVEVLGGTSAGTETINTAPVVTSA